jgi:hypothetical protein
VTDLHVNPPTAAELTEALRVWDDPTHPDADLLALCGDEDRAGVMVSLAVALRALATLPEIEATLAARRAHLKAVTS